MSTKWAVKFKPSIEELSRISDLIEEFAQKQHWQADLIFHMQLAIDEVITNVVEHGKESKVKEMEITLLSDSRSVVLEIEDDGIPFNPLEDAIKPDVTLALEERPIGGLGLHLIRTLMDEKNYQHKDGKNLLTLVKRRE